MNRTEILHKITKVVNQILKVENFVLTESSTAKDFAGWDSFTHIKIIVSVEEEFKIRIPIEKITKLNTTGDLVDAIESLIKHPL